MNRIERILIEKNLTVGVVAAALNIDEEHLETIISNEDYEKLDCMQIGEFARVLDIELDEVY